MTVSEVLKAANPQEPNPMSLDVYLAIDVDTGGQEPYRVQLFTANITHNLNVMAEEAGLYEALWRPEEVGIATAAQLIEPLTVGLDLLMAFPERFTPLNPANGWGDYKGLVEFVQSYLEACQQHPKASVSVWR